MLLANKGEVAMVDESEVRDWGRGGLAENISEEFVSMATFENAIRERFLEVQRAVLEEVVQEAADKIALDCPVCKNPLAVVDRKRERTVESMFGPIRFSRAYGHCAHCGEHHFPADNRLGLHTRASVSPRVQEIAALCALRAPASQAAEDILRLTGIGMSASTLHREARRQGERALALRDHDEFLTQSAPGIALLCAEAPTLPEHSTLVIEIDAWNIRERDNWGESKAFLKEGKDTGRWHWVYTGTVFRLDHRGTGSSKRPFITERGHVATRAGLESFRNQLYAEALRRGMSQAGTVLVLADGAVWIWNLVDDRFPQAVQRLDLYHAQQHLWNLAAELHGKGTPEARAWVAPYIAALKNEKDGALETINGLKELGTRLESYSEKQKEAIRKETAYLENNRHRMDYKTGADLGQPVGSGAIESTCSQYQRRFKMTGQFWSLEGDEAFLALSTLHRNGRWGKLFPASLALRN
jgi:uncharacterized protein YbaR (Trm112 family)